MSHDCKRENTIRDGERERGWSRGAGAEMATRFDDKK